MVIYQSRTARLTKIAFAWLVTLVMVLPIYFWITVTIKTDRDVFTLPPKLVQFEPTASHFKAVLLGISPERQRMQETGALGFSGGGNTYMVPRLVDSVIIAVVSTILTVAIAVLAAYALSRLRFRGQHHFVYLVLTTRMLPPVAAAIPLFLIYKEIGLYDTHTGVILAHTFMNLPLAVLLLKSFFDDIPKELDEAALIDGASRWQIFWRIALPTMKTGIAATAVLCFIFSWTEFLFVLMLTATSLKTVPVASSGFVTSTGTQWGSLAALGVAALIPAFIFILLVQKNLVRGLTLGSLKG
ncbi:MAG: carbohydrate ABC transporter permease [Geminicoccaceae bacterium]